MDTKRTGVAALVAVAAIAGGTQLADAAKKTSKSRTTASTQRGNGETALTGATADSVKAAILAKYPGATIKRASTETDGKATDAYEAHVVKADGTKIEVFLNSAFAVTGEQADRGGRGHHGRGGRDGHGRGSNGETELTGATLDSVKAAVVAKYPGSTVDHAGTETDGKATDAYEAKVTKSDGTRIEVFLDKAFTVTGSETHADRGPR
jgi:uncharacterized membrane protein YkoI